MIKEFKVGAGHTVNRGNYNSLRLEAEVTWILDEGELFQEAREKAQVALNLLMKQTFDCQSEPPTLDRKRGVSVK